MNEAGAAPTRAGRYADLAPGAGLAIILLVLALPVILFDTGGSSEAWDEQFYHLPVIETLRDELPRPDIVEYQSATAPGYHLLHAIVWRVTGAQWLTKAVNLLFSMAFVGSVGWILARYVRRWWAFVLGLPLVLSPYVLGAAIWLTTDNTAWLFVVLVLGGTMKPVRSGASLVGYGVLGALASFTRQIHIWLIAPIALVAALQSPLRRWSSRWLGVDFESEERPASWGRLIGGCVACLIPIAIVGTLVVLWGGLIPRAEGYPSFHGSGPNPSAPAIGLALTGVFGTFLLPLVWERARRLSWRDPWLWIAPALALGAALGDVTDYEYPNRAHGWIWRLVQVSPVVAERSVVLTLLAMLGAVLLVVLFRCAVMSGRRFEVTILLVSMLAWISAQTMNTMAWHRYFEPFLLFAVPLLVALGADQAPASPMLRRARWLGPIALACAEIMLSSITLFREAFGLALSS